ncbi:thiamine phosphate synthase [Novosphingobium sp.]|uniref:thiamine phosphate synthase n=1 Tax=Novosphingobium sp. TaxID=1874826 RepID=UPI0035B00E9B
MAGSFMARCYSDPMSPRHPVSKIWLVSDARNDAALERALKRLPRGSGLIFRHYHLSPPERRARFKQLRRLARQHGHRMVLSGTAAEARRWGADGAYGADLSAGGSTLRLVTVHSLRELRRAHRADAVLLSPVFPTRSHPGGKVLGPVRWRAIAALSPVPVIALGGMTAPRARRIGAEHWAGIDAFLR